MRTPPWNWPKPAFVLLQSSIARWHTFQHRKVHRGAIIYEDKPAWAVDTLADTFPVTACIWLPPPCCSSTSSSLCLSSSPEYLARVAAPHPVPCHRAVQYLSRLCWYVRFRATLLLIAQIAYVGKIIGCRQNFIIYSSFLYFILSSGGQNITITQFLWL